MAVHLHGCFLADWVVTGQNLESKVTLERLLSRSYSRVNQQIASDTLTNQNELEVITCKRLYAHSAQTTDVTSCLRVVSKLP